MLILTQMDYLLTIEQDKCIRSGLLLTLTTGPSISEFLTWNGTLCEVSGKGFPHLFPIMMPGIASGIFYVPSRVLHH